MWLTGETFEAVGYTNWDGSEPEPNNSTPNSNALHLCYWEDTEPGTRKVWMRIVGELDESYWTTRRNLNECDHPYIQGLTKDTARCERCLAVFERRQ